MNTEIATTLGILLVSVWLFATEKVRPDLVALLVLSSLSITGIISPQEATSGFSSSAVITVWAMFILSAGLTRTGVAAWMGRRLIRVGGKKAGRLSLLVMVVTIFLSAFMNNVGVTALLLPVVLDISKRHKVPSSKLLIPLAYSSLLGGMITMIGTPPNIIVSEALESFGYQPLSFFAFAPAGIAVSLVGLLFIMLFGPWLLPKRKGAAEDSHGLHEMTEAFQIEDRIFGLRIPKNSRLAGKPLKDTRLGAALGVTVVAIQRNGTTLLAPDSKKVLLELDKLLVIGKPDKLLSLLNTQHLVRVERHIPVEALISEEIGLVELELTKDASLIGQTLEEIHFRQTYNAGVLALWRHEHAIRTNLETKPLQMGDTLLVQASHETIKGLIDLPDFQVSTQPAVEDYRLDERLNLFSIPAGSSLAGKCLADSHLGDAFGMGVLAIIRNGSTKLMPEPQDMLLEGDEILAKGRMKDINAFENLQELEIDNSLQPGLEELQSDEVGILEIMLSPQTSLLGKTLRQIKFREKYNTSVLGIWRAGRSHCANIRDMSLQFGDVLLSYGQRDKLRLFAEDSDFLYLEDEISPSPHKEKAVISALIMLGVVLLAATSLLPIELAALIGFTAMVLTGCLSMPEAYRSIEWKAIFMIAGMLPLGIAMQTSGTAQYLAELVIQITSPFGPLVQLSGLFLLSSLASQLMPNAAVAVIMAPIALVAGGELGFNPHALMIFIAIAISTSFLSPIAHPSNLLIMGPGGYKFGDYVKAGIGLVFLSLIVSLWVLPF